MRQQIAFEQAKEQYPASIRSDQSRWQLVDAVAASFRTPEREGMLVLQEVRKGCRNPFNHWGFMVARKELEEQSVLFTSRRTQADQ